MDASVGCSVFTAMVLAGLVQFASTVVAQPITPHCSSKEGRTTAFEMIELREQVEIFRELVGTFERICNSGAAASCVANTDCKALRQTETAIDVMKEQLGALSNRIVRAKDKLGEEGACRLAVEEALGAARGRLQQAEEQVARSNCLRK